MAHSNSENSISFFWAEIDTWSYLDDAVLEGEADHLDGGRETEFVEEIGLMRVHGADGDLKLIGDLLAEFAGAASLDDLKPSSKTSVLVDFSYFTFPFLKISEGIPLPFACTAIAVKRIAKKKQNLRMIW